MMRYCLAFALPLFALGCDSKQGQQGKVAEKIADKVAKDPEQQKILGEVPYQIHAFSIEDEFDRNEISANSNYLNKLVHVVGDIAQINAGTPNAGPTVWLKAGTKGQAVICHFKTEDSVSLAKLSKSQYITVKGRCSGRAAGGVAIHECTVEARSPTSSAGY